MKKNWLGSLRTKIIAWSFVPTAIILSAAAWFTFYSYQEVLGDLAIKQDWAILQSRTRPLYQAFFDITNPLIVEIILQVDSQKEAPLEIRAQNILNHAQGIDIFDGGIYFVDPQGKVVKTHPGQPELLGQDWSDTIHFRFMVDHPGKAAYSDLRYIETSGKEILCVSASMNGPQGDFVGADYYCFTIYPPTQNAYYEAYSNAYSTHDLGSNIYILDGNKRIIFSTDPSELGRDLSGEAYLQQLLQSESMSGRFRKGEEDVLVSYAPFFPYSGASVLWNIIKEESWAEIMRPTLPYRQLLCVLLALGVAVPTLVTAYGVRHITGPIQKLIRASERVTAGQFEHRIEVNTGDEIETLADQFNLMSARLADSYSSLEKKVTDRTRELAILNSIISVASHSLDLREILGDALGKTVELVGFEAGAAVKVESDPGEPLLVAHRGLDATAALDLGRAILATGRSDAGNRQGGVVTFELGDLRDMGLRGRIAPSGLRMFVQVPLRTKGRSLGLFILGRHSLSPCSSEELSLLTAIGQQVGVAMENAHLFEQAGQTATATERNRLARELHDAVTQTLFSANLIADVIPGIWKRNPEEGLQNLEELRQLTRGALAEMRTLLLEMRPETLERSEIKPLLTQLADAFVGRVRVPVSLVLEGDSEPTQDVKLVFYRVAQEALNNITKHSGAKLVALYLACQPGHVTLSIRDDGLGFDPGFVPPDHIGIAIMRERASSIGARLKIESQLGQGTTVELDWPAARED
jgi:nitrate/nitrite-specific signal transduction histidine kinase